jgi:hypothetical protein
MRRVLVSGSIVLACLLPQLGLAGAPLGPNKKALSFSANVVTLVDDLGRYVVLVDSDRNGGVDQAILYEAAGPLAPSARRFVADARVLFAGEAGPRRVEVADVNKDGPQPIVQIDLDAQDRREVSHGDRLRGGIALVQVSGYALWPDADRTPAEELKRRGLPTFEEARTEQIRTSRPADDPELRAMFESCSCKDCTSGGTGATSCTIKCQGKLAVFDIGEDCNVQCGNGYYACCGCKGLFAAFGSCECVAN